MKQQEMEQQRQLQEQQIQSKAEENKLKLEFEADQNDKERQKDITVAEIRASGYGAMQDINENQQSDLQDSLQDIRETSQYREQMNFKREQSAVDNATKQAKLQIEREKLATQREIADKQLQIARENKNKYDKEK